MINPLKPFATPEYFFRPAQMLVRLKRAFFKPTRELERVTLPWGAPMLVRPSEVIGSSIWYWGIFDLIVAEAIERLLDAGETAIDIGANIGQMSSLMSRKVGEKGKVLSFEPHPKVFAELAANIEFLGKKKGFAPVTLYNLGLSDRERDAVMEISPSWANNRGIAQIAGSKAKSGVQVVNVQLSTLEKILGSDPKAEVCKIDVEGHELKVVQGAARLLRQHRIRDVIFEDSNPYPNELEKFLSDCGFTIFFMHYRLLGPLLLPLAKTPLPLKGRDRPDFLATLNPRRALKRFRRCGWQVLM
jgi:FkbM family methyltransferase